MDLRIEPFWINILLNGNTHHLKVEQCYLSQQIERFRVVGKNRSIVLESDRPMLRTQQRRKQINWKLKDGVFKTKETFSAVLTALDIALQQIENPPPRPEDNRRNF